MNSRTPFIQDESRNTALLTDSTSVLLNTKESFHFLDMGYKGNTFQFNIIHKQKECDSTCPHCIHEEDMPHRKLIYIKATVDLSLETKFPYLCH